jgi:1-phosphatidylinositol-3-phosphate 5-kinase
VEFQKFASGYISHLKDAKARGKHSILAKIYGLYELTIKNSSFKCIVMQNLFFDLEEANVRVYDLKGSETNRLKVPEDATKKETGLDTNFKIDKNHQPYILEEGTFKGFY